MWQRYEHRPRLLLLIAGMLVTLTAACGTTTTVAVSPGFITVGPASASPSPVSVALIGSLFPKCAGSNNVVAVERKGMPVYVPRSLSIVFGSSAVLIAFVNADPQRVHDVRLATGTDVLFDTGNLAPADLEQLHPNEPNPPVSCVPITITRSEIPFPLPVEYQMYDPLRERNQADHPEQGVIEFCSTISTCPPVG